MFWWLSFTRVKLSSNICINKVHLSLNSHWINGGEISDIEMEHSCLIPNLNGWISKSLFSYGNGEAETILIIWRISSSFSFFHVSFFLHEQTQSLAAKTKTKKKRKKICPSFTSRILWNKMNNFSIRLYSLLYFCGLLPCFFWLLLLLFALSYPPHNSRVW